MSEQENKKTPTSTKVPLTPEFKESLLKTLACEKWMKDNAEKLKALYPTIWTHMSNLNGLKIGFSLKSLGIDWRTNEEFSILMVFLERIGVSERQNLMQIRANPNYKFDPKININNPV